MRVTNPTVLPAMYGLVVARISANRYDRMQREAGITTVGVSTFAPYGWSWWRLKGRNRSTHCCHWAANPPTNCPRSVVILSVDVSFFYFAIQLPFMHEDSEL